MRYLAEAARNEIARRTELQAAMRREGIRLAVTAAGWPASTATILIDSGLTARGTLFSLLDATERVQ